MFFVGITRKKIMDSLQCINATELRYDTFICTIVTDSFLSKLEVMQDGFSVVESPLISYAQCRQIVFSEVIYNQSEKLLEISRFTISGRPIYYFLNQQGELF